MGVPAEQIPGQGQALEGQQTGEPDLGTNQNVGPTDPPATQTQTWGPTPEYVALLENQLREQNRQIQELVTHQTATPATPAPTERDLEDEKAAYFSDPLGRTRDIVRTELQATVAPLLDFVKEFKGQSAYGELKNRFRYDPRFGQYLSDPNLEAAIDQIMLKAEKTDANMQAAIVHAVGLRAINALPTAGAPANGGPNGGQPPTPTQAQNPQTQHPQSQQGASVPQPAHMRPSGSQQPKPEKLQRRQLNELEKKLAHQRWPNDPQAEEKYLNWLELPADQVTLMGSDGKPVVVKK